MTEIFCLAARRTENFREVLMRLSDPAGRPSKYGGLMQWFDRITGCSASAKRAKLGACPDKARTLGLHIAGAVHNHPEGSLVLARLCAQ